MVNMAKIISTIVLVVVSFFSISHRPALAASDLRSSVEAKANRYYNREQLLELLYDKKADYEKVFNCQTVRENIIDQNIYAVCSNISFNDVFSIQIIMNKAKRTPSYVQVCKAGFSEMDPYKMIQSAYHSEPAQIPDGYGNLYYMGRTNGWVRDFENLFLAGITGDAVLSCWGLNKR